MGLGVCLAIGLVFLADYMTREKVEGPAPLFSPQQERKLRKMGWRTKKAAD